MKKTLARIVLLLFALTLMAVVAEIGFRTAGRFPPHPRIYPGDREARDSTLMAEDPLTGWRMKPFVTNVVPTEGRDITYCSNGDGYRTACGVAASTNRPVIALLGDSFVFGVGVDYEKTFAALMERPLNCRVVNLAQPGFGVDQIMLALKHQLPGRHADLAIAGLYMDDFPRCLDGYQPIFGFNKPLLVLDGGRLRPWRDSDRPCRLLRWLEKRSRVYTAMRDATWKAARFVPVGECWRINQAVLDEMMSDARAQAIPLLFVYIPYETWRPFPLLGKYMHRRGAAYLDLRDASPPDPRALYLPEDRHLNEDGHRFVTDALLKWIEENRSALGAPFQRTAP